MGSGGIQLRISDLLFAVQKRWKIIVALTVLGAVFGLMLSGMSYVQSSLTSYSISGSAAINTLRGDGTYLYGDKAPSQNDFHLAEDMADSVIYIMRSDRVLSEVINRLELLGVTSRDLRNGMSVTSYNGTQILEFTLNWTNSEEGTAIWQTVIDCANEILPETLTMGHLSVINPCTATMLGVGGSGRSVPVLLAILGFAAGVGFAVMELLMHPTLTNVKDIETVLGLETIGLIPRDDKYFKRKGSILVKDESASSTVSQNYSAAAFILRNRLGTKENHHCFYVTSATEHEGRSSVAANLAIQLSDMEHRTLLVDFDFKNPSLGSLFMNNVDYEHSLNALYRGEINEREAVTTLTGYLDILPSVLEHNAVPMDSMVMDLIRKLSEKYEYVILDAPPVGKESETLSLNQLADTVLFVVGYDSASIPEIQGALNMLDKSGIRVLGCVVNNVQGTRYKGADEKKSGRKPARSAADRKKEPDEPSPGGSGEDAVAPLVSRKKEPKSGGKKKKGGKPAQRRGAPQTGLITPETPEPDNSRKVRDVVAELSQEDAPAEGKSDQDMLEELYRIGAEREQDKPPES